MTTMNSLFDASQLQQTLHTANASLEAIKGFWGQLLEAQLASFETAVGQLEQAAQRQVGRAQGNVDETARLAKSAMGWLAEIQTEAAKTTLQALKSVSTMVPKAAV